MLLKIINRRLVLGFMLFPDLAFADQLNQANTAWVLTSTALVLFMTIPGLSLFYGGLVRSKNVLSILMQCFAIACLVSILWLAGVYSFVFADGGELQKLIGGASKAFLPDIGVASMKGDIPETVFFMFQMTFAIITPALIVGGFAERMKFSAMLWFSGLWLIMVYCRSVIGCGAAAGWLTWARWILPEVSSSMLMPVLRRWWRRWYWAKEEVFPARPCLRII